MVTDWPMKIEYAIFFFFSFVQYAIIRSSAMDDERTH